MNPIQLLANLRRLTPEAQRWLSRTNNGTTDAYQEHLRLVLNSFEEFHAEAIMASIDDEWKHGIGMLQVGEDGVQHIPFDEYHGGRSD